MGLFDNLFVDVKHGSKVTYSESDLRKLDRTYEKEILADDRRRVMSPLRKIPQQAYLTQIRDYAFERILDSHMYTFQHLLVIPNPYDIVKQSALLLFNSSKEAKVRYRVLGDTPEADFVGETGFTKRHRVPVLGLYLKRSNKVILELINREEKVIKRRMIRIYVSESPKKLLNILGENTRKGEVDFPFILVNGVSFNPMAVDCDGQIRYSIQLRTNSIGMIPLENGHFLYEDRTANRMDKNGQIKPCRYHEMDYMGRVYRTFLLESPIEGFATQDGDSLFLVTSSDENHRLDQIIEMDMKNGQIVKCCNLSDLIGDKYMTQENWAYISSLYCRQGKLVMTLKKLHTLMEIDWETLSVDWMLAPESVWKGTKAESFILKGECPPEEICRQPDYVSFAGEDEGKERLFLFQEKTDGIVPVTGVKDPESQLVVIEISRQEKEYRIVKQQNCVKTRMYGCGIYRENRENVFLCSGAMEKMADGHKCKLVEMDLATGKELRSVFIRKGVNRIWEFLPDISSYGKAVEVTKNVIFGEIAPPEIFTGTLQEVEKKPVPRTVFSGTSLCENLFISSILPGKVQKIYFVGEQHAYVQDYSRMVPGKVKFPFVISLDDFAQDEYYIYVESDGKLYQLKNEIRVQACAK